MENKISNGVAHEVTEAGEYEQLLVECQDLKQKFKDYGLED